ncbi:MAG: pyridoxamine 5'-phosphate oxidase family protein [Ilumatobacteraceae bacterium]
MPDGSFSHTVDSVEALRQLYRQPHEAVVKKERPALDAASTRFIELSRFVVIGTFDGAGRADSSPRGGPSGFVRVLDATHLAIADLGGNNRLDTLQNVVDTGRIGLLFVVPGQSETVRVNGAACITTDPTVLARFDMPREAKSAIGVTVETTYVHCAKAFRRSGMWDPNVWAELAGSPDAADIIACQYDNAFDAELVRADLSNGYDLALRWEAGEDVEV